MLKQQTLKKWPRYIDRRRHVRLAAASKKIQPQKAASLCTSVSNNVDRLSKTYLIIQKTW